MKKFLLTVLGFALLPTLFACKSSGDKTEAKNDEFKLTAIVKNVGEYLEVEIIESDYAFGEYWVITSLDTEYSSADGEKITRSDLKSGDKIEIFYGGQVMMSYPPKIVAARIKLIK